MLTAEQIDEARKGGITHPTSRKILAFPFKLVYFVLALCIYLVFFVLVFPFVRSTSRASQISSFMFPTRLR